MILGTAQFGLDYGISNTRGKITQTEVAYILSKAAEAGICTLDTAAAYGNSEESIGKSLQGRSDFNIITKYPPNTPEKSINQAFEESLKRLETKKLYAYLLHSFSSYQNNPTLLDKLLDLKAKGRVEKIGVSVYHPKEAEALLQHHAAIDIVQLPYSVFDQRFNTILPKLRRKGIETHVRSIYLQGLYFMQQESIPQHLQKVAPKVKELQHLAAKYKLPLGAMLMGFVLRHKYITNIVVGVESLQTLEENIAFYASQLKEELYSELQKFEQTDEDIILPYKWAKA
ncbi:aldo/keto reductase [Pontibacter kalidii]|uniref:aldo/keto reductase n=1 Tax=Pontibacter kalidii TaxID=2592049 RepID=UPI00225B34CF|nr:aldo/keto reductase [Pontibacter kalidii]